MKLKEFYGILRSLPAEGWKIKIEPAGDIRLKAPGEKRYGFCPVTAVLYYLTGKYVPEEEYQRAGKLLGLPEAETIGIGASADSNYQIFQGLATKRSMLLRAVPNSKGS